VHLRGLTKLSRLSLDGTQVIDAGVLYLKGLPKLSYLGVGGTGVTDFGVRELKQALPNLIVVR
jgi:hypothetical protein